MLCLKWIVVGLMMGKILELYSGIKSIIKKYDPSIDVKLQIQDGSYRVMGSTERYLEKLKEEKNVKEIQIKIKL